MLEAESVVAIENLSLELGRFALRDIELLLKRGEYTVLLGPTGGGKTVLLETIVGLHRPTTGTIRINGRQANDLAPEDRNVGYIPQDYALFPNLTVADNVGFGPFVRGWDRSAIDTRVAELLDLLGITHLAEGSVEQLSGGERQRVAVGRALAVEPELLILDEPLSALDESLRVELAAQLKTIQRRLGATFLHVCHDLDEAAQVADRVVIINDGRIIQHGTIGDLLERPSSGFVARFTGARNVFPLRNLVNKVESGHPRLALDDGTVLEVGQPLDGAEAVAIRPEALRIVGDDVAPACNLFDCEVVAITPRAMSLWLSLRQRDRRTVWTVAMSRGEQPCPQVGEHLRLFVPPEAVWPVQR